MSSVTDKEFCRMRAERDAAKEELYFLKSQRSIVSDEFVMMDESKIEITCKNGVVQIAIEIDTPKFIKKDSKITAVMAFGPDSAEILAERIWKFSEKARLKE